MAGNNLARALQQITSHLKMVHMKCSNEECNFDDGVSVEKTPTGKPRMCPMCKTGVCHEVTEE